MKETIHDHNFSFDVDRMIPQEKVKNHPKYERFMELARGVAEQSVYDCYRLGSVLVLKSAIVGKGYNKAKTHPQQKKYNAVRFDITDRSKHHLHAEMVALNQAKHLDLSKAELYIYHVGRKGEQKMARPCAGCMKAIKDRGIKKIHYSTPDGIATEYLSKDTLTNVKRGKILI